LNRGAPAALDALGLIPGEGTLLAAGQLVASIASLGISLSSGPAGNITTGEVLGAVSVPVGVVGTGINALKSAASVQTAKEFAPVAKIFPAVGNFVSAASLLNDFIGPDGINDYYNACLAGKN
jgi:hypothetical protein